MYHTETSIPHSSNMQVKGINTRAKKQLFKSSVQALSEATSIHKDLQKSTVSATNVKQFVQYLI